MKTAIQSITYSSHFRLLQQLYIPDRKALFEGRKTAVEEEIRELERTLSMLKYKCWYYETAIHDGSEDRINEMLPDKLPPERQKLYDIGHGKTEC